MVVNDPAALASSSQASTPLVRPLWNNNGIKTFTVDHDSVSYLLSKEQLKEPFNIGHEHDVNTLLGSLSVPQNRRPIPVLK